MEVREAILTVVSLETDEVFLKARDKKHGESMRVIAYRYKQSVPKEMNIDVGIQLMEEDSNIFLRIYNRSLDGDNVFVRDKESGKLVPVSQSPEKMIDAETRRMISLMKEDGKTEEEIEAFLKENK